MSAYLVSCVLTFILYGACVAPLLRPSSKRQLTEAAEALLGDIKKKKKTEKGEGTHKSSSSRKTSNWAVVKVIFPCHSCRMYDE